MTTPAKPLNSEIMSPECQHDFGSFWSVAVNSVDKTAVFIIYICCFIINYSTFYSIYARQGHYASAY